MATKTKRLKKNRGASEGGVKTWELRLYVAGQTPKSMAAFSNLKKLCEERLKGEYHIEVIDLLRIQHWPRGTRSSPSRPW